MYQYDAMLHCRYETVTPELVVNGLRKDTGNPSGLLATWFMLLAYISA
jgi:hypothetical protein